MDKKQRIIGLIISVTVYSVIYCVLVVSAFWAVGKIGSKFQPMNEVAQYFFGIASASTYFIISAPIFGSWKKYSKSRVFIICSISWLVLLFVAVSHSTQYNAINYSDEYLACVELNTGIVHKNEDFTIWPWESVYCIPKTVKIDLYHWFINMKARKPDDNESVKTKFVYIFGNDQEIREHALSKPWLADKKIIYDRLRECILQTKGLYPPEVTGFELWIHPGRPNVTGTMINERQAMQLKPMTSEEVAKACDLSDYHLQWVQMKY